MPLASDSCLCLRKFEYSETSQILTLFSREHGVLRAIAKGAHRRTKAGSSRFDGGIDLLDFGAAVFTDDTSRDLATLTEWKLREGHLALRSSLRAQRLGLYAAEMASLLIEERDPHIELFDRLLGTIPLLATRNVEESFLAFQIELLRESGYLPSLFHCASCGRETTTPAAFSPIQGGILCEDCVDSTPDRMAIDPRLVRLMQYIARLPRAGGTTHRLPNLSRAQTDPINRLLAEHLGHTLGRRMRLWDYVLDRPVLPYTQ